MTSAAFPDDSNSTSDAQRGNRPAQGARQITAAEAFGPNGLLKEPAGDFLGLSDELPPQGLVGVAPEPMAAAAAAPLAPGEPLVPEPLLSSRTPREMETAAEIAEVAITAAPKRGGRPKWLPFALGSVGVGALAIVALPYLGSRGESSAPEAAPKAAVATNAKPAKSGAAKPSAAKHGAQSPAAQPAAATAVASAHSSATHAFDGASDGSSHAPSAALAAPTVEPGDQVPFATESDVAVDVSTDVACEQPDALPCVDSELPSSAQPIAISAPEAQTDGAAPAFEPHVALSQAPVAGAPASASSETNSGAALGTTAATSAVSAQAPFVASSASSSADALPFVDASKLPSSTPVNPQPSAAANATPSLDGVTLVWSSAEIPKDFIARPGRLQTPNVGTVQVLTNESETFVGRLVSVGQGKVWLEVEPLGKLAFDTASIRELSKPSAAAPARTPDGMAPGTWWRSKTEGGSLYGKLVASDGARVTLQLENGARIAVDTASLESARPPVAKTDAPKTKVMKKQDAPKPAPKAAPKVAPKPKAK